MTITLSSSEILWNRFHYHLAYNLRKKRMSIVSLKCFLLRILLVSSFYYHTTSPYFKKIVHASAQKPSNTRARNCILEASSLMSVLNKLPPSEHPSTTNVSIGSIACIEIKVRILLSKCGYFITLWKRLIETLLTFDFFLLALRSCARSRHV